MSCGTLSYKLTSFGGPQLSGEMSAIVTGTLRCCVLQEGMRGVETGVKPVPPTMSESKLNCIPVDGVVIGTPAISIALFLLMGAVAATLRELGRLGFEIGTAELSMIRLAAGSEKTSSTSCITSVLTRSWGVGFSN